MKSMNQASESFQAGPPGKYPVTVTAAEAGLSSKGAPMITLEIEIADGPCKGMTVNDYLITDGTAKGAGIAKRKLRGLGIREVDSDAEIPDGVICQRLLGMRAIADLGNEQAMGRRDANDPNSPYDRPMTTFDSNLGKEVPLMKFRVNNYSLHNVGVAQQAPIQQQFAQAPQQGYPQQAPQQFAPPQQFTGVAYPQQGVAQPAYPQQGYPQQAFGGPGVAAPPWAQQAPVQPVPVEEPAKRARKTKINDVEG